MGFTPRRTCLDPVVNRPDDMVQVCLHHRILKPKKLDAHRLKFYLPHVVHWSFQLVTLSIDLDSEHQLGREEIDDVFVNRFLPVKVITTSLPLSQRLPQEHFTERTLLSQFSRPMLELGIIF
jgi:hypothetical protein